MSEQTAEQRIENLNTDAEELDRRADALPDPGRDAERENLGRGVSPSSLKPR